MDEALSLVVRQMAWLNATPRPDPSSARAKGFDLAKAPTRIDAMKKAGIAPQLPPNPAPSIIDRLIDVGLTEAAGMGAAPLSWREIVAWQDANWIRLTPWEAKLLRRLSAAYLTESRLAESENRVAPWRAGPDQRVIDTEQARLEALLG